MSYKLFKEGHAIGIFPEGHDSMTQKKQHLNIGRFYPGFCEYALRFKVPIVPVSILPNEEHYGPMIVPKIIRELLKIPEDVINTDKRLIYDNVTIKFNKPITIEPYIKELKQTINMQDKQEKKNVEKVIRDKLCSQVKKVIEKDVKQHRKINADKDIFKKL